MEFNNKKENTTKFSQALDSKEEQFIISKHYNFLSNYSWIVFGVICLIISYLVVWQRGLYLDDYSFRFLAFDPVSETAIPFFQLPNDHFPMRILVWILAAKATALVPEYEFWIRVFQALLPGFNSLFLGILVYRILKSRLAAIICGGLFLSPVFSAETVLWLTTIAYTISAGFAILAIIFTQIASAKYQGKTKFIILAALFFTMMMFSFEGCMAAIGILILISFITTRQNNSSLSASLRLTFQNTIWLVFIFGIIILIFRQSPLISNRGGVDTSIPFLINKALSFCQRAEWMTLSGNWGLNLLKESFMSGYSTLLSSVWNLILFSSALVMLVITTLTWRNKDVEISPNYQIGLMLLVIGIMWTISSILMPGIFSKGQIVEYRMLYFPAAGLCVTIASLFWLIGKLFKFNKLCSQVLIGITGAVILSSSIIMLGYCELFAERHKIDEEQISSVIKLLPPQGYLPPNVTLVLYKFDENADFKYRNNVTSNKLLFGVFETSWSARDALKPIYKGKDLNAITQNRWADWRFTYDSQLPVDQRLIINGKPVMPDNLLFITYRDGKAYLVNQLIIDSTGNQPQVITFPLAEYFRLQGAATISLNEKLTDKQLNL